MISLICLIHEICHLFKRNDEFFSICNIRKNFEAVKEITTSQNFKEVLIRSLR